MEKPLTWAAYTEHLHEVSVYFYYSFYIYCRRGVETFIRIQHQMSFLVSNKLENPLCFAISMERTLAVNSKFYLEINNLTVVKIAGGSKKITTLTIKHILKKPLYMRGNRKTITKEATTFL